jgi:translation initiation factor 1
MLDNTCAVCGLPNELCVCQEVEKIASKIEIKVERRKYGKFWAVVSGIDSDTAGLKELVKKIKNKMAVAGTIKGKNVEVLFGRSDKTKILIECLIAEGFDRSSISTTSFK